MKKVLLSSTVALSLFWLMTPAVLVVRADDETGATYADTETPMTGRDLFKAVEEQDSSPIDPNLSSQFSEARENTPQGDTTTISGANGDKILVYGEGRPVTRSAIAGPSRAISRATRGAAGYQAQAQAPVADSPEAEEAETESGPLPKTSAVK